MVQQSRHVFIGSVQSLKPPSFFMQSSQSFVFTANAMKCERQKRGVTNNRNNVADRLKPIEVRNGHIQKQRLYFT